ncbi:hypothetical protein ADJ77_02515 [Prevotella fusca JCM 17724]|uniref:Uncharacterized protein n=1 Tax=Prevotella fusca JCM 17724 TaxID=1236517 RepID=A0A0K1NI01_9BACT|nr:hypothetical protein ADJ77_02515 [Prevotella fusca JCM 17724]
MREYSNNDLTKEAVIFKDFVILKIILMVFVFVFIEYKSDSSVQNREYSSSSSTTQWLSIGSTNRHFISLQHLFPDAFII